MTWSQIGEPEYFLAQQKKRGNIFSILERNQDSEDLTRHRIWQDKGLCDASKESGHLVPSPFKDS